MHPSRRLLYLALLVLLLLLPIFGGRTFTPRRAIAQSGQFWMGISERLQSIDAELQSLNTTLRRDQADRSGTTEAVLNLTEITGELQNTLDSLSLRMQQEHQLLHERLDALAMLIEQQERDEREAGAPVTGRPSEPANG